MPHLHPGTEQTPMYVCTGGAQAARRIRCRTHTPFPFRTLHIRTHALCYHPHLCNLLVLSNLPFFLPQQNRKRKRKKRALNYVPCHPHFGLLMVSCDYHVTKIFAAKKMPIELLITITQSYCNYSYLLAAPAL